MTFLGKYELHEQLGKGGFGIVYRATDTSLNRVVALKVLHPQLMVDETFIERFKREARTLASLDHPNIVAIHELGEVDGRIFLAMRYLPGGNLQLLVKTHNPLGYKKAIFIMKQICEGLQVTHNLGLVHRDIKPANILFDARGNAVISDFGLARAVQLSESTTSGMTAGTPAYRAPELWRGKPPARPATDVYSLGCILTEMLTGKVLFDGETPDEILTQHLIDGPNLPEKWPDDVPGSLPAVLTRALSKDLTQRQKDAEDFLIDITHNNETRSENLEDIKFSNDLFSSGNSQSDVGGVSTETVPSTTNPIEGSDGLEWNKIKTKKIEVSPGLEMEFLCVPTGEFLMGSNLQFDKNASRSEMPQHWVHVDEYWIGKYPVTVAQYQVFLEARRHKEPSDWNNQLERDHLNYPVVNITWLDAVEFCHWLSKKSGKKISLPTEAQWEKAARGTDGRIYPWGNETPDSNRANYHGCKGCLSKVGSFPAGASPYGVQDMAGNVWEWTADWYEDYPAGSVTNPTGPKDGEYRVLRGGAFDFSVSSIRTANRTRLNLDHTTNNIGFRCALSQGNAP